QPQPAPPNRAGRRWEGRRSRRDVGRGHVRSLASGAGQSFSSRFSACSPWATVHFKSVVRGDLYFAGKGMVGLVSPILASFSLASACLAGLRPFMEGMPEPALGWTMILYSPGGTSEVRKVPSWVTGMLMPFPSPEEGTRTITPPLTGLPL